MLLVAHLVGEFHFLERRFVDKRGEKPVVHVAIDKVVATLPIRKMDYLSVSSFALQARNHLVVAGPNPLVADRRIVLVDRQVDQLSPVCV